MIVGMTKPKIIYFDVGGVLMHFYHIRDKMAAELGIDPVQFWDLLKTLDFGRADGSITEQDTEEHLRRRFKLTQEPGFWADMHWMQDFQPILEMHDLVAELAKKYRVGLITNVSQAAYEAGRKIPGLWPVVEFDPAVLSYAVQLAKPDPKIYELAITLAGCLPAEILFVDDMPENLVAAEKVGLQTFQFHPAQAAADAAELRRLLLA